MQFKNKLLLFIYPAIVIPVAIIIAVNFTIAAKKVAELQFELLINTVNNVLSKSDASFKAMDALGMAKVEFFIEATKKQILLDIQKNQTPGASMVVIDTRSDAVVFSTGEDAQGLLLDANQIHTMIAQREGHGDYTLHSQTGDTIHALAAFAQYPNWNWLIVSSVNKNQLYRYVFDAMVFTLVMAGVLLVAVFFFVRRLANAAGHALAALEQGAARIARNNFDDPIHIPGEDEFSSLAKSFNTMAGAIKETQASLEATLNAIPDLLFEVDANGRIHNYHARRGELLAVPPERFLGKVFADFLPPAAAQVCLDALHEASIRGWSTGASYALPLPQGETWFELSVALMPRNGDPERHYVVLARDITERIRSSEKQRELGERLALATRAGNLGVWDWHIRENTLLWDATMYALYGVTAESFGGNYEAWKRGVHPDDALRLDFERKAAFSGEKEYDTEFRVVWPTGEIRHLRAMAQIQRGSNGQPMRMVGINWDISTLKAHQSELEHLAHFDALTDLPNRALLTDRLQHAMALARRNAQGLAVAYLDLDGFKLINDSHGHKTGDQVLVALAGRMHAVLRDGDTLARVGGDEFVAVLLNLPNVAAGTSMFKLLLAAAADPVHLEGEGLQFQVSASIGVAFYAHEDEVQADQLMRQADQAMYQAKLAGKNRFYVFDAAKDSSIRTHHEALEHLRAALERQQFVLYYQPKVNMRSGEVVGAEALIRWQHPQRGLLAPAAFLSIIEDHPLAIAVGEWVIDAALTQIEQWRAAGLDISVSVNVGARQLQQADFVARLQAILARHPDLEPACLEMEILETSALADMVQVSRVIASCAEMGIRFALDDFGTGYSSLIYLKRLRAATIKIDQSFVHDMLTDPDDLSILTGVIGLARAFKREVVAEGVETLAHGTALLQLGCELAQGHGIAHPMPADAMPDWARNWQPDAAWRIHHGSSSVGGAADQP